MGIRNTVCFLASMLMSMTLSARGTYRIDNEWRFFTYNENAAITVNLPHTWNNDALSGRADYYRGTGNYLRYIQIPAEWSGKRIYIRFGGSNQITDLLIDGRFVGQHRGGNNAFTFDITNFVTPGQRALLWVMVNNSQNISTLPTAGAENCYGGLFRSVDIIVTENTALDISDSTCGIHVETGTVSRSKVTGTVRGTLLSTKGEQLSLRLFLTGPDGRTAESKTVNLKAQGSHTDISVPFTLDSPVLWDGPESPALYTISLDIMRDSGNGMTACDSAEIVTGFRDVSVSGGTVTLNGRAYPLHGVVLHRDSALEGAARTDSSIEQDVMIMRSMGVNAVRVYGGAHSECFYDLCDRFGILVINDLPLIGATVLNNKGFFNTSEFRGNGQLQLTEMIAQLRNHPSVMAWNLFSELELRGEDPTGYIRTLHQAAKEMDPTRLTTGYSNQDGDINFITDLIIWSHSFGWSDGQPEDIAIWRDMFHREPQWANLKSAVGYRCGGVIGHIAETPTRPIVTSNFHPESWQTAFNETYYASLTPDSLMWGMFVDSMFDYGSVSYIYGQGNGVSDTGLVSSDRSQRKDSFYLYKSNWNADEPMTYIPGRRVTRRTATVQDVTVYSNAPSVELFLNGVSLGTRQKENGVFRWSQVEMVPGENTVRAVGEGAGEDSVTFEVSDGNATVL